MTILEKKLLRTCFKMIDIEYASYEQDYRSITEKMGWMDYIKELILSFTFHYSPKYKLQESRPQNIKICLQYAHDIYIGIDPHEEYPERCINYKCLYNRGECDSPSKTYYKDCTDYKSTLKEVI